MCPCVTVACSNHDPDHGLWANVHWPYLQLSRREDMDMDYDILRAVTPQAFPSSFLEYYVSQRNIVGGAISNTSNGPHSRCEACKPLCPVRTRSSIVGRRYKSLSDEASRTFIPLQTSAFSTRAV